LRERLLNGIRIHPGPRIKGKYEPGPRRLVAPAYLRDLSAVRQAHPGWTVSKRAQEAPTVLHGLALKPGVAGIGLRDDGFGPEETDDKIVTVSGGRRPRYRETVDEPPKISHIVDQLARVNSRRIRDSNREADGRWQA